MLDGFCYRSFGEQIRSNFPLPLDERLLNRVVQLTEENSKFLLILTEYVQFLFQHACVSSLYGPNSSLFIFGMPYALDTYPQFATHLSAIFSWNDRGSPMEVSDIEETIVVILSQNGPDQGRLRDRLASGQEITTTSMNELDEGMNLVVFNAQGFLRNDHFFSAPCVMVLDDSIFSYPDLKVSILTFHPEFP
jgi:hypothetical protein